MEEMVARLLMSALRGLFEFLVPHSLGLASREILMAVLMLGALWAWNRLRDVAAAGACRTCRRQTAGGGRWWKARLAAL